MSNALSQRAFSGGPVSNHYYSIDARGTDPALTEQRVYKAIQAAHQDAVQTSLKVNAERLKRMPTNARG